MNPNHISCARCSESDLDAVVSLVRGYHAFEHIEMHEEARRLAVQKLLSQPELGSIWGVYEKSELVGYIAICPSYTIEMGGKDAFIDEFFLLPQARGRGIGKWVLQFIKAQMVQEGIVALHLIVADGNTPAIQLYEQEGFVERPGFKLRSLPLT